MTECLDGASLEAALSDQAGQTGFCYLSVKEGLPVLALKNRYH